MKSENYVFLGFYSKKEDEETQNPFLISETLRKLEEVGHFFSYCIIEKQIFKNFLTVYAVEKHKK